MLCLGEFVVSRIQCLSGISIDMLIDKLLFDGLIMKKLEWAGNLPEIILILVTHRPTI